MMALVDGSGLLIGVAAVMLLMMLRARDLLLGLELGFALPVPALCAGEMGVLIGIGLGDMLMVMARSGAVGLLILFFMVMARRLGIALFVAGLLMSVMFYRSGVLGIFRLGVAMEMASVSESGSALRLGITA